MPQEIIELTGAPVKAFKSARPLAWIEFWANYDVMINDEQNKDTSVIIANTIRNAGYYIPAYTMKEYTTDICKAYHKAYPTKKFKQILFKRATANVTKIYINYVEE